MEKGSHDSSPSPNKTHRQYAENNSTKAQAKTGGKDGESQSPVTQPPYNKQSPTYTAKSPDGRRITLTTALQALDKSITSNNTTKEFDDTLAQEKPLHSPNHSPMHGSPHKAEIHRTTLVPIDAKNPILTMNEEEKPIPSPETSPHKGKLKLDSIPALVKSENTTEKR